MITLNGVELAVDFTDADVQQRYADASEALRAASDYDGLATAEIIRKACGNVRAFIDTVYGAGLGDQVLPRDSARETMAAVEAIVQDATEQFAEVERLGEKLSGLGSGEKLVVKKGKK